MNNVNYDEELKKVFNLDELLKLQKNINDYLKHNCIKHNLKEEKKEYEKNKMNIQIIQNTLNGYKNDNEIPKDLFEIIKVKRKELEVRKELEQLLQKTIKLYTRDFNIFKQFLKTIDKQINKSIKEEREKNNG